MKKTVLEKLTLAFGALSLLFGFASCAADAGGGSDGGSAAVITNNNAVVSNTALYRIGNSTADCAFADDGTLTNFGSDGSYLYYPVALDLDADSAELSATVDVLNVTGKMGVGLIDVKSGAVDSYVFETTSNKVRYNTSGSDAGSGWTSTSLTGGKCTGSTSYTFKVNLASKKLTFDILDSTGTNVATKSNSYSSWITANGKVYLAIGSIAGSTSYITYSNIKVSINGGTTYTIDEITDIPDQSSVELGESSVEVGTNSDYKVSYTALDSEGNTTDVTAVSSNDSVASVVVDKENSQIVVTGLAAGSATITVTNSSNTEKTATISVVVTAFNSVDSYDLVGVYPANGATAAYEDGEFMLTFDSTPTLNDGGSIKIYDADGNEVDSIAFADETQTLFGTEFGVEDQLVRVDGNSVYFTPHIGKIENGKTYYVSISDGAITGTMSGSDFTGLTNNKENTKWKFTTRAKPSVGTTISVDGSQSSSANFRTIQGALNAIGSSSGDYKITVAKGIYRELLYFKGSANVEIEGQTTTQYGKDVEVRFANAGTMNDDKNNDEKKRCLLEFVGGNLVLENIYFNNTFLRSNTTWSTTKNTQAEALGFDSGKSNWVAAYNCGFYSHQDTIRTIGKGWFYGCYITGDVDFIWQEGNGLVQLVEKSEIVALGDDTTKAYLVAPGASQASPAGKGSVILNSTVDVQCVETYYGRSPWSSGRYNNAAIVNTTFTTNGNGVLKADYSNASCTDSIDDKYVGWKTYGNTLPSGVTDTTTNHVALTEDFYKQEYSGRRAILNRVYTSDDGKFVQDTSYNWDVDSLISEQSWTVDTDSSSELASGETAVEAVTYTFSGTDTTVAPVVTSSTGDISGITLSGITYHDATHIGASSANGYIQLDVTGACIVSFEKCKYSKGTITGTYGADGTGTTLFTTDASCSSDGESVKFYYDGTSATKIRLTYSASAYTHSFIKIEYTSDTLANEVTSVSLTGEDSVAKDSNVTLTATVSAKYLNTLSSSVEWTSSNNNVATVANGVVTGVAAGTATITASAGGKSATKDVTVTEAAFDASSATVTWDLTPSTVNIQNVLGTVKATVTGSSDYLIRAAVDASASGKLQGNGAHAQMNSGTKISIPVTSGAVLSVTANDGAQYALYTIDGTAASTTEKTSTYTATSAKWIEIVSTGTAYPCTIVVTGLDLTALPSAAGLDYIWSQEAVSADSFGVEGSAASYDGLYVDATSGKFKHNGSSWIQVNTGTAVYVPVTADCTITVAGYAAGYSIAVNGTDVAMTDNGDKSYTYSVSYNSDAVSLDGYSGKFVKLTMGSNGYWGSIKRVY